uniref:Uncharacterized protein n=1 Tax=viral metagenome TaxID=1070528 RepID=A0A6C0E0S9_9ZZZZ
MYNIYKTKDVTGLSFDLILLIYTGDVLSYITAKAKGINIIITIGSIVHAFLGGILLAQWVYYNKVTPINEMDRNEPYSTSDSTTKVKQILGVSGLLLVVKLIVELCNPAMFYIDALAWFTTFLFISSRIPQIYLNYFRKSVTGLSLISFVMLSIANILFVATILVVIIDLDQNEINPYIWTNIQWIFGGITSTLFDFVIYYQFYIYDRYRRLIISPT